VNVRVNANVQFQNLFIKCNTSEVYPLQEMVRFSLDEEPTYTEANKSYENTGSNHSLELKPELLHTNFIITC